MAPSQSNDNEGNTAKATIELPKRTFTIEFFVGLFAIVSLAAAAYLSVGLGGLEVGGADKYVINAEFDNVSGLKYGASVEIAGVKVGEVADITLNIEDSVAIVRMKIDRTVTIMDDDIASIRTKGIIGDRYVKISRGGSDLEVGEDGTMTETESVVDIEDIIGKFVHNFGSDDDE